MIVDLDNFELSTLQNQIRDTINRQVKDVVSNAPSKHNIPVINLETKTQNIFNSSGDGNYNTTVSAFSDTSYMFGNCSFRVNSGAYVGGSYSITCGSSGNSPALAGQYRTKYDTDPNTTQFRAGVVGTGLLINNGDSSALFGYNNGIATTASYSLCVGRGNTTNNAASFVAGYYNTIYKGGNYGDYYGNAVIGANLHSKGYGQVVVGKQNKYYEGPTSLYDTTGSIFIVGNGSAGSSTAGTNALRITTAGQVMGTQSFTASGADYAEYYEWADGNPNNEDRRGRFVTYDDGDKIRIANSNDDYVLGVISSRPAVIGNGYTDEWQGRYLTDVYGQRLTEIVEVPEEVIKDDDGNIIERISAHTDVRFVVNPDYDPEQEYVGRNQRKEWAVVGTHGQLVLIDNGTCTVNGYCAVGDDGTAIPVEKSEYRVIARLDDTHMRIVIK